LSEGTVAANTLRHGVGGLNIDACRTKTKPRSTGHTGGQADSGAHGRYGKHVRPNQQRDYDLNKPSGRWPANLILQHLDGCRHEGVKRVSAGHWGKPTRGATPKGERVSFSDGLDEHKQQVGYADKDGNETVTNWICEPGCPVARLDRQSGVLTSHGGGTSKGLGYGSTAKAVRVQVQGDKGGASCFFKQVGGQKDG
jgi:hypothetical protein